MSARPFLCLLALTGLVAAKSYSFSNISTRLELGPDGSVRVSQARTYSFDGAFTWAYLDLRKQGARDIVFSRLAERTEDGWREVTPSELTDSDRSLYIRWNYAAEDEERTFLIEYTIAGAVQRFEDAAEFYWKVIEDEHEPVQSCTTVLALPGSSADLFKVYVHSAAAPGKLEFSPDLSRVTIIQQRVPRNRFVEVRALAEPGLFTGVAATAQPALARILGEEKRNFVLSELRVLLFLPLGALLLLVVPIVLLVVFYMKNGREPKLDYDCLYEHEPPCRAPPAVVPVILQQKPEVGALTQPLFGSMMAQLLDLARRGAVMVQEERQGRRSKYGFRLVKPEIAVAGDEYDRLVTDLFFNKVGAGTGAFGEEQLKEFGKKDRSAATGCIKQLFDSGVRYWQYLVGEFVERASLRAYWFFLLWVGICCLSGAVAVVAGLASVIPGGEGRLIVVGTTGAVVLFCHALIGRSILRWRPGPFLEHRRWRCFRKFLKDFSAIEQAPVNLLPIWEQYYVYAVALGVADEFMKHVTRLAEQRGHALALPVWYAAAVGTSGTGTASLASSLSGFASFAGNMSSMMGSFFSATASGGGFSGGGGGGGGGGGSGAG